MLSLLLAITVSQHSPTEARVGRRLPRMGQRHAQRVPVVVRTDDRVLGHLRLNWRTNEARRTLAERQGRDSLWSHGRPWFRRVGCARCLGRLHPGPTLEPRGLLARRPEVGRRCRVAARVTASMQASKSRRTNSPGNRSTVQPSSSSCAVTTRSRRRIASTFGHRALGIRSWSPCQISPSTKIARRLGKSKSGVPGALRAAQDRFGLGDVHPRCDA